MSAAPTFTLSDLDARARDIFRDVVDSYLETGQPVGSKTLALSCLLYTSDAADD